MRHWWNAKNCNKQWSRINIVHRKSSVQLNAQTQMTSNFILFAQTMRTELFAPREEQRTAGCCLWFSERILVRHVTYASEYKKKMNGNKNGNGKRRGDVALAAKWWDESGRYLFIIWCDIQSSTGVEYTSRDYRVNPSASTIRFRPLCVYSGLPLFKFHAIRNINRAKKSVS